MCLWRGLVTSWLLYFYHNEKGGVMGKSCEICGYLVKRNDGDRCEFHEGLTLIGTCGDCACGNYFNNDEGMYCDNPDVSIYECDADFGCRLWEKKTDVRG